MSDGQVREWNSVDNILDRFDLCKDVTLMLKPLDWMWQERFKALTEKYFPLMWQKGRVVLDKQLSPYNGRRDTQDESLEIF